MTQLSGHQRYDTLAKAVRVSARRTNPVSVLKSGSTVSSDAP